MESAWRQAAQMLLLDAHAEFVALVRASETPSRREAEFGEAVTLSVIPPHTEGQVERSVQILRRLRDESSDDQIGMAARYMLGRMQQARGLKLGEEAASPELLVLVHEKPESFFGQLAMLKLTLHRIYLPLEESAVDRFQEVVGFEEKIKDPRLLCDYHLMIANAQIFFDYDQPTILRHLQAALMLGIPDFQMRADVRVQIGELAKDMGKRKIALDSYQTFLRENPLDGRVMMVRDRIEILGGIVHED